MIFRPKSEIQTFFPPKIRWSPKKKKKKVFTEIESDFSPEIVRFRLVGGEMRPEMDPNFAKLRLIFRPKSLLLGWWGGMHPPIPPLNPPLTTMLHQIFFCFTGRKILLIVGAVFMTLSLFAFGLYFQLQKAHSSYVNEMTLVYFEMLNSSTIEAHALTNHHGKKN